MVRAISSLLLLAVTGYRSRQTQPPQGLPTTNATGAADATPARATGRAGSAGSGPAAGHRGQYQVRHHKSRRCRRSE